MSKLDARRATRLQYLRDVAYAINPADSTSNCGYIIDAVIARTCGRDPHAVAAAVQGGSFADIEARHNTAIVWGLSFNEALGLTDSFAVPAAPGTVPFQIPPTLQ